MASKIWVFHVGAQFIAPSFVLRDIGGIVEDTF